MNDEQAYFSPSPKPILNGWQRALLILLPYLIIVGIFQVLGMFAAGLNPLNEGEGSLPTLMQNLIIMAFSLAGTVFVVSLFTRLVDRSTFKQLGFQCKGAIPDTLLGLLLGAVIMGIGFCCLLLMGQISITGIHFDAFRFFAFFLLFIMVAISEELVFRGYILTNLMQSTNKYLALLISSVLFALMHVPNASFNWFSLLSLTLAGILLGISYVYTKSLWFPMALHFSWNFFQGPVFGFSVSGNQTYSLITQTRVEDNLINGGAFGFENSLLAIGLQLLAIVFIAWRFKPKSFNNGKPIVL